MDYSHCDCPECCMVNKTIPCGCYICKNPKNSSKDNEYTYIPLCNTFFKCILCGDMYETPYLCKINTGTKICSRACIDKFCINKKITKQEFIDIVKPIKSSTLEYINVETLEPQ